MENADVTADRNCDCDGCTMYVRWFCLHWIGTFGRKGVESAYFENGSWFERSNTVDSSFVDCILALDCGPAGIP
jgi:hypothetical protein